MHPLPGQIDFLGVTMRSPLSTGLHSYLISIQVSGMWWNGVVFSFCEGTQCIFAAIV